MIIQQNYSMKIIGQGKQLPSNINIHLEKSEIAIYIFCQCFDHYIAVTSIEKSVETEP